MDVCRETLRHTTQTPSQVNIAVNVQLRNVTRIAKTEAAGPTGHAGELLLDSSCYITFFTPSALLRRYPEFFSRSSH